MSEVLGTDLPRHWGASRLKHVTSFLNRGTAPDYADDGPVRVISQAANQQGGIDWERTRFHTYDQAPHNLRGYLYPNDILINSTGTGTLGRVGFFDVIPNDISCMADGHVTIARASDEELEPRFAYYWLSSAPFYTYIYAALAVGATNQIELSRERLGDSPVPLPPLDEQRRIADFLDAETARIDQLIAAKTQTSDLLDERRVAITSHLCLGRDSDSPTHDSEITPVGRVPRHWPVVRNKNILFETSNLSSTGSEELLSVSHLSGVTPRSEKTVYMFMAESTVGYKICAPGDLVINTMWAWMGALGVSRNRGVVSPAYGVYRFASDRALPEYFDLLYRTPEYVCEMTRHSRGVWSSRLRLYPESFLALRVPLPPLSEQRSIVAKLEHELAPEKRLQGSIARSSALIAERRQALITAAVTGQIDVTTAGGVTIP